MKQSTFLSEEPRASLSQSQDLERAWLIRVGTSRLHILQSLTDINPAGWFGKTSPASCQADKDGILAPSLGRWQNSGMGSPTECLTLSTSEHADLDGRSPSDGDVCSLSDILETGDVPQRFYSTPKACRGILRRAARRGKELPMMLRQALSAVAGELNEPETREGKTR